MSESYRLQILSGWTNLQGLQLAQIPELRWDRSAKLVRRQAPNPRQMSESYRLRNLSGWINLQGLQLAQIPEPWRDRTTKLVRGQVPIPTRMSILQSADCIQMGRFTVAAAGSDSRAPVGSLRLHGSRTGSFSDESE